jgi:transcriptional regulator with XRE-family HTH domain
MKTLSQYIASAKTQRTHQEWAEAFGISRSYFTDIVNEKVTPGSKVIRRINEVTRGKVPPSVWFVPSRVAQAEAQGAAQ